MAYSRYSQQVSLLIRCLPAIRRQADFAIKGGTAINLFIRNMPRLSVDIDLTYLPLCGRDEALKGISTLLERIVKDIEILVAGATVQCLRTPEGCVEKLLISTEVARVKIEPNTTIRGSVYGVTIRELCQPAQVAFELDATAQTLSFPDVYGGKICAALDRQHPRDLYDVYQLLAEEGLTPEIMCAFVVYLASHSRPMHELLRPKFKDISRAYSLAFAGMTREDVSLVELITTRQELVKRLHAQMGNAERHFLLTMKQGNPDWNCLGIQGLDRYPALQWKLQNIRRMSVGKHRFGVEALRKTLEL